MKFTIYLLFFLVLLRPNSATFASWQEIKGDLLSPYQNDKARPYFYSGAALTAMLALNRDNFVNPLQEDIQKNKPMSEDMAHFGDLMGQLIPNALYMGGMYWHYKSTQNIASYQRAELMFKTSLYAGMTTTVLKRVVNQRRPDKGDHLSFPSGHTTTAFAFAAVVGIEHDIYASLAAYSLATVVAISRMQDNVHYLHDVVFGATLGISYAVALKQRQNKNQSTYWQILPVDNGAMMSMSANF
jgi:membrane-associated phospholipid phosphatase